MMTDFTEISKQYEKSNQDMMDVLIRSSCVEEFIKILQMRMLITAKDISRTNDANMMFTLRGQISICDELINGAVAALEAKKASANASNADGLPSNPEMTI